VRGNRRKRQTSACRLNRLGTAPEHHRELVSGGVAAVVHWP
jgi:hypothetical protein